MQQSSDLKTRIVEAAAKLQKAQAKNPSGSKTEKTSVQLSWGSAMRR